MPDGGFSLSAEQDRAIGRIEAWYRGAYRAPVFRVDGYAGSGKWGVPSSCSAIQANCRRSTARVPSWKGAPDVMLTQIHRQALESAIIEVATMAREGVNIQLGSYGNQVVKMRRADLTTKILMSADQVICRLNRTREELNLRMRIAAGVHQPLPSGHPAEKVICLENNYERGVLNGAFLKLSDIEDEDEESFSAKNHE